MPVFEKTAGGTVLLRGIDQRVSVGDRVDVDEEFAVYLAEERGDFREVDVQDVEHREVEDDNDADEAGDSFDAAAFVDRTPVGDVVDDIEAGEVDDHLAVVAEAAARVTVEDAVGERRAELED